jgi:ribosomal protein L37AE/L43A
MMKPTDPRIPEQDLCCPSCGSGDVEQYGFYSQPWMCNKCGWAGNKDELKKD